MRSLITYFLVVFLFGFLVGCSSDDDDFDNDVTGSGTDAGSEIGDETDTDTPAVFIGSWRSACTVDRDDDGDFDALIYGFDFTENTYVFSFTTFLDENCTSPEAGSELLSVFRFDGSYSSVGQVTTTTGLIANALVLSIDSGSLRCPDGEIKPADLSGLVDTTPQLLLFVDDSDVLFVDDLFFLATPDTNTLILDVPFQRQ